MQALENRIKVRKLLVFSELKEICMNEAKLFECPTLIKDVKPDLENGVASYNGREHFIRINMHALLEEASEWANKLIDQAGLVKKNRDIYANILILVTINHELNHVFDDYRYLIRNMDEIEFFLMYMSCMIINSRSQEFYDKNYLSIPCERNAEITAWVKTLKLIECLDLKPKELFELQRTFLTLSVTGYEFSEKASRDGYFPGPFDSMLEKEYNYEYVSRKEMLMSSLNKYSAYDRTRLGLPLTIEEMSKYATLLGAGEPVDIEKIIAKSL